MRRSVCAAFSLVVLWVGTAVGVNSVRIDSVDVPESSIGGSVDVGVFFENDVPIQAFIVPLVARSTAGGLFFTNVDTLPWANRLAGSTLTFARGLTKGLIDGTSPDQFLLMGIRALDPPMSAGTDEPSTPSVTLQFALNGSCGAMEFDTLVFPPNAPLSFVEDPIAVEIFPSFVKGAVTCVPCACPNHGDVAEDDGIIDVLDVVAEIDFVFRSGPELPVHGSACPATSRGEVTCDGTVNVLDVVRLIDFAFRLGLAPCDPCACTVYPMNCP